MSVNTTLPKGWKRVEVLRKQGMSKGKVDIYIISPKGKKIRSKKELSQYIQEKKLNLKIKDFNFSLKNINKSSTSSDISSELTSDSSGPVSSNFSDSVSSLNDTHSDYTVAVKLDASGKDRSSVTPISSSFCCPHEKEHIKMTSYKQDTKTDMCMTLLSNGWVCDDTITLYTDYIQSKVSNQNICFVSPVVSKAINAFDDLDFCLKPIELKSKSFIFVPINDAGTGLEVGGSHWSLLFYVNNNKTFYYLDSIKNYNLKYAKDVFQKLSVYARSREDEKLAFEIINCPQQKNSVDCGIYILLFVDWLINGIQNKTLPSMVNNGNCNLEITDLDVIRKRVALAYLTCNDHDTKLESNLMSKLLFKDFSKDKTPTEYEKVIQNENCPRKNSKCFTQPVNRLQQKPWSTIKHNKKYNSNGDMLNNKKPIVNENVMPLHDFNLSGFSTENKFQILEDLSDNTTLSLASSLSPVKANQEISSPNRPIKNNSQCSKTVNIQYATPEVKVILCADSQGKMLASKINELSYGKFNVFGYVQPSTTLLQVVNSSKIDSSKSPIVILGGSNDSLNGNFLPIYNKLEERLSVLSKTRPIFITTIPIRNDKHYKSEENMELYLVNNYITELTLRLKNVFLIDLNCLNRSHFTTHGLHLNKKGKTKVARVILSNLSWWSDIQQTISTKSDRQRNEFLITPSNQADIEPVKDLGEKCNIVLTDKPMYQVINKFQQDETVGFAHFISSDFENPHHMTAGVAAVFRKNFGKPNHDQRITNHLALQKSKSGAAIYSLITKEHYYGKPNIQDYETAFQNLTVDFKNKGLKHLICSPIGCVRDNICVKEFIYNLTKFQYETKSKVTIVNYYQNSYRQLRNGLSHDEFNYQIQKLISIGPILELKQTMRSDGESPLHFQTNPLLSAKPDNCQGPEPDDHQPSPASQRPVKLSSNNGSDFQHLLQSAVVISDEGGKSLSGVVSDCGDEVSETTPLRKGVLDLSLVNVNDLADNVNKGFLDVSQM